MPGAPLHDVRDYQVPEGVAPLDTNGIHIYRGFRRGTRNLPQQQWVTPMETLLEEERLKRSVREATERAKRTDLQFEENAMRKMTQVKALNNVKALQEEELRRLELQRKQEDEELRAAQEAE